MFGHSPQTIDFPRILRDVGATMRSFTMGPCLNTGRAGDVPAGRPVPVRVPRGPRHLRLHGYCMRHLTRQAGEQRRREVSARFPREHASPRCLVADFWASSAPRAFSPSTTRHTTVS